MTDCEKVGYARLSSSGKSLKIYIGTRYVGLLSIADLERCKKSQNFVATIIKFNDGLDVQPKPITPTPEKRKRDFSLYLLEPG
jgi:hypothetical protein